MHCTSFAEIDWGKMWKQAQDAVHWQVKGAEVWDERAPGFAQRTRKSSIIEQCLTRLAPEKKWSVLDIGSGPGTLALPLSALVRQVTCLDFSAVMLSLVQQRIKEEKRNNISICQASWTDDWHSFGLKPHDVAIACRSLAVRDLPAALKRLTEYGTTKRVIVDRVGFGPIDPAVFAAVGRPLQQRPDYIFVVNALYQQGFHAEISFLYGDMVTSFINIETARTHFEWMLPNLTAQEKTKLTNYVDSIALTDADGRVSLQRSYRPKWAYISW